MPAKIFICYSHEDSLWRFRVQTFMQAMRQAGEFEFEFWDDSKIGAGENWRDTIDAALDEAVVGVPLVSVDFMASDFINEHEIPALTQRAHSGDLTIVPLLLRPCPWTAMDWLAELQFVNLPEEPLSACTENRVDEILTDLSWRVHQLVEEASIDFDSDREKNIAAAESERVQTLTANGLEHADHEGEHYDETFLTNAGVTSLIEDSVKNPRRQPVVAMIRIFRSRKQRTWLAATAGHVFCVLDDAKTAAGNRQVQWAIQVETAQPVRVRQRQDRTTGLVDVGPKRNWLYSQRVYPDADSLRLAIEEMINLGRRS